MFEFVNIHTHQLKSEKYQVYNVGIKDVFPVGVKISLGLHPWHIDEVNVNEYLLTLNEFCEQNKLDAIGEAGIDRAIETSIDIQKEVFLKQVEIASNYKLPLIIHSVKANSDIIQLYKQTEANVPWIIHGFSGNSIEAQQLSKAGIYLCFGEGLLKRKKLQDALKITPIEKVFFETDESNIPIKSIYEKASEILGMDLLELKKTIFNNFQFTFNK